MLEYDLRNVHIDDAGFNAVFNSTTGPVGQYMARRGRAGVLIAKARVGVRTGRLKSQIGMRHERGLGGTGQVVRIGTFGGTSQGYATMHALGTRPHLIRGGVGRQMTFRVGGRRVYAKTVRHPGTRPNSYLTDAIAAFR